MKDFEMTLRLDEDAFHGLTEAIVEGGVVTLRLVFVPSRPKPKTDSKPVPVGFEEEIWVTKPFFVGFVTKHLQVSASAAGRMWAALGGLAYDERRRQQLSEAAGILFKGDAIGLRSVKAAMSDTEGSLLNPFPEKLRNMKFVGPDTVKAWTAFADSIEGEPAASE